MPSPICAGYAAPDACAVRRLTQHRALSPDDMAMIERDFAAPRPIGAAGRRADARGRRRHRVR
jgi:hypothetical protein